MFCNEQSFNGGKKDAGVAWRQFWAGGGVRRQCWAGEAVLGGVPGRSEGWAEGVLPVGLEKMDSPGGSAGQRGWVGVLGEGWAGVQGRLNCHFTSYFMLVRTPLGFHVLSRKPVDCKD